MWLRVWTFKLCRRFYESHGLFKIKLIEWKKDIILHNKEILTFNLKYMYYIKVFIYAGHFSAIWAIYELYESYSYVINIALCKEKNVSETIRKILR